MKMKNDCIKLNSTPKPVGSLARSLASYQQWRGENEVAKIISSLTPEQRILVLLGVGTIIAAMYTNPATVLQAAIIGTPLVLAIYKNVSLTIENSEYD
jgi:hypothetical protein